MGVRVPPRAYENQKPGFDKKPGFFFYQNGIRREISQGTQIPGHLPRSSQSGWCSGRPHCTRCGGWRPGQIRDNLIDAIISVLCCFAMAASVTGAGRIGSKSEPISTPTALLVPCNADGPLPRPVRRKKRAQADRGLPPDDELRELAIEFLNRQRQHWPDLAAEGLLPEPTDSVVQAMVDDFKRRHRGGHIDPATLHPYRRTVRLLGGSYSRYSCDNSSPKSIVDQLVNELDKARLEDRFIPWDYVFADYSISGLSASRRGYLSYKALLKSEDQFVNTTYIDDFTRASRDELEWWKLAAFSKRTGKRLIGASDGFDLSNPNADVLMSVYSMVSRLFLKGLSEKVRRGMKGTVRRGGTTGRQALGFTRRYQKDDVGNLIYDGKDRPKTEPCHDPATREFGTLLFDLADGKNWSPYRIWRHFNTLRVDGWDGWTEAGIRRMLRNPTYIGVFIWNKTRSEYDLKSGWLHVVNRKDAKTKTRRTRKVPIHPSLRDLLVQNPPSHGCWFFSQRPSQTNRDGKRPISTTDLNIEFMELARSIGMRVGNENGLTAHSLRHFFERHCVHNRIPQKVIDAWMGHVGKREMSSEYFDLSDAESQNFMLDLPFSAPVPATDVGHPWSKET